MKLRLRSLQSKETVKLEIPNNCTLPQLQQILSRSLSSPPPFFFSLNRKDELLPSSPQDPLLSLGITAGDLIYYSLIPDDFSRSRQILGQEPAQAQYQQGNFQQSNALSFNSSGKQEEKCGISNQSETLGLNCPNKQTLNEELCVNDPKSLGVASTSKEDPSIQDQLRESNLSGEVSDTQMEETLESTDPDGMDIDSESSNVNGKRVSSEPYFLKRVLREELGEIVREELGEKLTDNKLLFVAIHAVFLEYGFIGFDSASGLRVDLFRFLKEHSSLSFTTSVKYTLPELLVGDIVTESVVLNFQTLGHFVNVYGSLTKDPPSVHKLSLNKYKYVPSISLIWVNSLKSDSVNEIDEAPMGSNLENQIFDLWRVVRDGLAYPLLSDLCEKTGLDVPPSLMRLPVDLQLKILESVPGLDLARMACVCKEMSFLSSNNELWKQKYAEEFGSNPEIEEVVCWKAKFVSSWDILSKKRKFRRPAAVRLPRGRPYPLFGPPPFRGDDFDWLPVFRRPPYPPEGFPGVHQPHYYLTSTLQGQPKPFIAAVRRNFAPKCKLGGFNA